MARSNTPRKPKPAGHRLKPRKGDRRIYTEDERAHALVALAANDYNIAKTAEQLGMPDATLRSWHSGFRRPDSHRFYLEKKGNAAVAMESILWDILPLARERMHDATFRELMTGAGIAVDKMRLLRGESTAINGDARETSVNQELAALVQKMTYEERQQLRELFQRAADREPVAAEPARPDEGDQPRLVGSA